MGKGQSKSPIINLPQMSESEAHRRLEDITRLVSDWVWEVDQDYNITFISDRVFETLGYHPRELIGKPLDEVINFKLPASSTLSIFIHRPFRDNQGSATKKNDEICHLSISGVPVFNMETGDFEGVRGTANDITATIEAEKNLRESESRYRSLIEFQRTGIIVLKEYQIVFANDSAIRMFGARSAKELMGKTTLELTHPDYHETIKERSDSGELNRLPRDLLEIKHLRLDGSEFHSIDNAAPIVWEKERAVIVSIFDTSATKEAERAVAESEKRFREFAETAADRFWETDSEHRFSYLSPPIEGGKILSDELPIGKCRWDLPILNLDNEAWQKHREDLDDRRPFKNFHYQIYDRKGNIRFLVSNGRPQFDDEGNFTGYRGTTVEETDYVHAQEKIADIQQQFFTAIENFSEGYALWDENGKFIYCNSYFRLTHPSAQQYLLPGQNYTDFIRTFAQSSYADIETDIDEWVEHRINDFDQESVALEMHRNGRWVQIRKNRLSNGSMMVLYSDITEMKAREQALRDSQDRLRLITDAIPAMIAYHDRETCFQFANKEFEKIGLDSKEIIGKTIEEVFPPDNFKRISPHIRTCLAGEATTYDNYFETEDGKTIFTQVSLIPDFDIEGEVQGLFVLSFDITERKRFEGDLEASKSALDIAQRIAKIGSWERKFNDDSRYWSEEHYRIFGLDPTEHTIDRNLFYDLIHPDDRERMSSVVPTAIDHMDRHYSTDFRIVRPDGTERYIHGEGEILYNEEGLPLEIRGVSQDVTDRKRVEEALEEAHSEAEFANKAKSEFLSSMSHELRTPMNAILGYAQLLLQNKKEPLQGRQTKQVNQILLSGQHLLKLINDILDLAKIESGRVALEFIEVETTGVIEECVDLVNSLAERHDIEILPLEHKATELVVTADQTRLKQALLNLLSNAIKYNKPGGSITITSAPAPNQKVRISVEDTGFGIPIERQSEIFEPFSRLGADQRGIEGTGIGLTITKQLIELMDGEIGFHSKFNDGSTFWFELPLAAPGNTQEKLDGFSRKGLDLAEQISESTTRLLLYIEDDPSNLHLMEEFIDNVPYLNLLTATSAEEGLEIARSNQPDIIIMDINLPGMSGIDAMAFLSSHDDTKEIPVIALSAAAMPHDIEKGRQAGFFNYLTKPFDIEEVLENINKALDLGN